MNQQSGQKSIRTKGKLIALFALFFLLFNFPFLGLIDDHSRIYGIPSIYLYLLLVWIVLICVVWRVIHQKPSSS